MKPENPENRASEFHSRPLHPRTTSPYQHHDSQTLPFQAAVNFAPYKVCFASREEHSEQQRKFPSLPLSGEFPSVLEAGKLLCSRRVQTDAFESCGNSKL